MSVGQPDIEIYLKRVAVEEILAWLGARFEKVGQAHVGATQKLQLTFKGEPLTATIVESAVRGGYTAVQLEPNVTPWLNDEACAEDAFGHFNREVRCSIGGWTPGSDDTGGWYRYTADGKTIVNWLT